MSLDQIIALLGRLPIFQALGHEHLQLIAFNAERRHYVTGELLYDEGEEGNGGMVILAGEVALNKQFDDGIVEEGVVGPGEMAGELAMIAPIERPTSARALVETDVLFVPRDLFRRVLEEFPDAAKRVHGVVAARLNETVSDFTRVKAVLDGEA